MLPMARAALDAGQFETARRLYRRLLQTDTTSVEARMGLGDAAVATRDSADAARWYLAALANAREPEQRHAALLAHGRAALSAGQLEAGRKSFARLIDPSEAASQQTVAWGFNGLGLTLLLAGDLRSAVAAMEQAVLRAPDDSRFQGNLSRALAMLTELDSQTVSNAADAFARPSEASQERLSGRDAIDPDLVPQPVEVQPDAAPQSIARIDGRRETMTEAAAESPATRPPAAEIVRPTGPGVAPQADTEVATDPGGSPTPSQSADEPRVAARIASGPRPASTPPPPAPVDSARSAPAVPPPAPTDDPSVSQRPDVPTQAPASRPGPVEDAVIWLRTPELAQAPQVPTVSEQADPPPEFAPSEADMTGRIGSPDQRPVVLREDAWTFVQAAAFASRRPAVQLSGQLRTLTDHPVWVTETSPAEGETLSRVRIGPVPSRAALLELAATLEAAGFGTMTVPGITPRPEVPPGAPPIVVEEDGVQFVQAGAYAAQSAAQELATRLAEVTEQPTLVTETKLESGEVVYRVRIGPIRLSSAMSDVVDRLDAEGYGRPAIPRQPDQRRAAHEAAAPALSAPPAMIVRTDGEPFVQVGAYASLPTAENVADRLRTLTEYPVRLGETIGAGGQRIYRVRIGPVPSYPALVGLTDTLEVAGFGVATVPTPRKVRSLPTPE